MAQAKDKKMQRPLSALGELAKKTKRVKSAQKRADEAAKLARAEEKKAQAALPRTEHKPGPREAAVIAAFEKEQAERRIAELQAAEKAAAAAGKGGALEGYSHDDRVAFHQAFAGVDSLSEKNRAHRGPDRVALAKSVRARAKAAEEDARERLDALVGGGVHFDITRHSDGGVEGKRRGIPDRTCRMLASGELAPVATLDLHGRTRDEVPSLVRGFVRASKKQGRLNLAIIHGKGNHSEGGRGVLQGAVVKSLTSGGAAPLVDSFATAPQRFGGGGAILLRLRAR